MDNTTIEVRMDELFELIRDSARYGIIRDYLIKRTDKKYIERDILMLLLGIDEEEKETDHE